jgi:hypothetical protein
VSGRASPYTRTIGGLLAALGASGTVGFYSAKGISDFVSTPKQASAVARLRAAAAAMGGSGADYGFTGYCGVERHDVKDLLDGFVPGAPEDTSVAELRSVPTPPDAEAGRTPAERVVYRVAAVAVAYKIEADSDVHLAIADPVDPQATMIAEFPAASCLARSSASPQLEAARIDLIAALGDPPTGSRYTELSPAPCVTLTGVAFFDRIHGQRGVAPNGIELHPVLAFQAGCGVPSPPPTTPTTVAPTTPEPPDTTPVTTVPLPTVSVPTTEPSPMPANGAGCERYPGRHWYRHRYHRDCRSYYFTTP